MKSFINYIFICATVLFFYQCNPFEPLDRIDKVIILNVENFDDLLTIKINAELIDNIDGELSDHGFCYSNTTTTPVIGAESTDTISLGPLEDPSLVFSDTIAALKKNNTYYIRAFYINDDKVIYSQPFIQTTPQNGIYDYFANVTYAISYVDPVNGGKVRLNGFVNKKRALDLKDYKVLNYGFMLSLSDDPNDNTNVLKTPVTSPSMDIIILKENIEIPANPVFVNGAQAYAFIYFEYEDSNGVTGTFYSKSQKVTIQK